MWLRQRLPHDLLTGSLLLIGLVALLEFLTGGRGVWVAPRALGTGGVSLFVALLCGATGVSRLAGARPHPVLQVGLLVLALGAVADTVGYYQLLWRGSLATSTPLPLSLAVAGVLMAALRWPSPPPFRWVPGTPGLAVGAGLATLLLIASFGTTRYERNVGCAIVLGAGVAADGTPSLALADRVAEGIRLYREGAVTHLLMTGGVDRHGHSEARVMARMARAAGVPKEAIILDEDGRNTRASARNCARILAAHQLERALVVSHYYHLARCKAAFEREGVRAYTVPAPMSRRLSREPWFVARECLAYLAYALP